MVSKEESDKTVQHEKASLIMTAIAQERDQIHVITEIKSAAGAQKFLSIRQSSPRRNFA